jgi:chloramphenicol-sensitive protein RarD
MNGGALLALGAYTLWGFLPLYLRLLHGASALEVVCHRVVWSFVIVALYLAAFGRLRPLARQLSRRHAATYARAAALISANWGTFIWAVDAGRTIDASLGYFLTPIISVGLGAIVVRERLSALQYLGVACATAGAVFVCAVSPSFPWIAFVLAATFGSYGLVKKQAPLPAAEGLALETLVLLLPAVLVLGVLATQDQLVFLRVSRQLDFLLVGAGLVTLVPLVLFAAASRRTTLATLGMLQYVAPTLQFLVGVFVFGEPLGPARLFGFAIVWLGLSIYAYGHLRRERAARIMRAWPAP